MNRFMTVMLLLVSFPSPVLAQDPAQTAQVDRLALATLMIHDGRYDKAEEELSQVDKSSSTFDAARYYTIRGVLDSKTGRYESAVAHYTKALNATRIKTFRSPETDKGQKYLFSVGPSRSPEEPESPFDPEKERKEKLEQLHAYLAKAYYETGDYTHTVKHLDLAGDRGREHAGLFALRAECYWRTENPDKAIHALNTGLELFPNDALLLKQKYHYFAELGLYQAAIEQANQYMAVTNADADEYILLAQLLFEAGQLEEAANVLETARAKFGENAEVDVALAHVYLKQEMDYTAAYLFKEGAYKDQKYLKDAVEMHRRIQDYSHAIFLTTQMTDKVEKLKQKVAIYLDRGEFEKVIGLKDDLGRYNLLEDDNMRYALAYSYYMAKDYPQAEFHLKRIQTASLFEHGLVILRNIERCREDITECF
jgi:tetratricopeptide (TPR) repeat protein